MTLMSTSKQYSLVSGAQLPNFIGKNVSLFGVVTTNATPGNTSFTVNTTDNVLLTVKLRSPLSEPLNSGVYVEVRGGYERSSEGTVIKCEEYFTFNNKTFAAENHTALCKLLNGEPNIYSIKN